MPSAVAPHACLGWPSGPSCRGPTPSTGSAPPVARSMASPCRRTGRGTVWCKTPSRGCGAAVSSSSWRQPRCSRSSARNGRLPRSVPRRRHTQRCSTRSSCTTAATRCTSPSRRPFPLLRCSAPASSCSRCWRGTSPGLTSASTTSLCSRLAAPAATNRCTRTSPTSRAWPSQCTRRCRTSRRTWAPRTSAPAQARLSSARRGLPARPSRWLCSSARSAWARRTGLSTRRGAR
mmetsp:Transcript_81703/g.243621  ORF Transcript_81703/g.243621 Transcript_81703/m.243621 type:complete len:233 (+) Transcript_81703:361-1059(+)